ncbi:MAG: hypothetical protein V3T86_07745 [Planctomycetota bacterium]
MRRFGFLLVLCATVFGQDLGPASAQLRLKDGRVLRGRSVTRDKSGAVLHTVFGKLRVPKDRLATGTQEAKPKAEKPTRRKRRTKWLEIESDLSESRAQLYSDQLDAFFDHMIVVYELDRDRLKRDAPYRMQVYRRRKDFKKVQGEVAPGIENKGQAFAEGVAGFYSQQHRCIFMWDAEGMQGATQLEVAKHETTHLLNSLLARQIAINVPTWFEEGAATYFSMSIALPGGNVPEPRDHAGALAEVIGEIEAGKPYTGRGIRSVSWNAFLGREYSWGWALVRFFRQHQGGKRWSSLLKHLRTVSARGPVGDSQEKRFLESAGFKNSAAFDRKWHAFLLKAKPGGRLAPVGTAPAVLERVAAVKKPAAALARNFARIGMSLARVREVEAAVVYLRAAMRGGVKDPDVPYHLALALVEREDLGVEDMWPREAVAALHKAVDLAPLRSVYRLAFGTALLGYEHTDHAQHELGLALLCAGPDDDDLQLAVMLLGATLELAPKEEPEAALEKLVAALPLQKSALRAALAYRFQEDEDWDKLAKLLEGRVKIKAATIEERAMLAGLYKVSDRLDDAAALYAAILAEDATALRYWPDCIECLLALGKNDEAATAFSNARAALKSDPRDLGWIRRRLDKLEAE